MKNTAIILSVALMLFVLISAVSADEDLLSNSTEPAVADDVLQIADDDALADEGDNSTADEDTNTSGEEIIQNATFSTVTRSNYLIGDIFIVKLYDENGTGIAGKTIYFTLNGKITPVKTDSKGSAHYVINVKKGNYVVYYNFNETGYNPIKASKKVLVLSKPVAAIKGVNRVIHAGLKYTYTVTLTADGIVLPGRVVKFVVNKKTYKKKTNSKGKATMTLYLKKGTYKIKYYSYAEKRIKSSKGSSKITVKLVKNYYKTKYRTVVIDCDGGFTKAFLKDIAHKLRMCGWKVIVKGIGPNQHSINYKNVRNAVYMPIYNGLCAATIEEMAYSYYGGVIKAHGSVLAPAWYTEDWTSEKMSQYREDITKIPFLKRAWDDNFSPASYKGLSYPAKFMTNHNIKYSVSDTTYKLVEQFVRGGWVKTHK